MVYRVSLRTVGDTKISQISARDGYDWQCQENGSHFPWNISQRVAELKAETFTSMHAPSKLSLNSTKRARGVGSGKKALHPGGSFSPMALLLPHRKPVCFTGFSRSLTKSFMGFINIHDTWSAKLPSKNLNSTQIIRIWAKMYCQRLQTSYYNGARSKELKNRSY